MEPRFYCDPNLAETESKVHETQCVIHLGGKAVYPFNSGPSNELELLKSAHFNKEKKCNRGLD